MRKSHQTMKGVGNNIVLESLEPASRLFPGTSGSRMRMGAGPSNPGLQPKRGPAILSNLDDTQVKKSPRFGHFIFGYIPILNNMCGDIVLFFESVR